MGSITLLLFGPRSSSVGRALAIRRFPFPSLEMDTELAKNPLAELSAARKIVLLFLFCLSPFLDTFNSAALFSAIPVIATSTGLNDSQSVWLNSAYQLSFAALLLIVSLPRSCPLLQLIVCV